MKFAVAKIAMVYSAQALDWGYDMGGDDWPGQCGKGSEQSPIDIDKTTEFHRGYLMAAMEDFDD